MFASAMSAVAAPESRQALLRVEIETHLGRKKIRARITDSGHWSTGCK